MKHSYMPHSDSLAGRVVAYFARFPDPDEALSTADIALKWGSGDSKNVPVQLVKSVEAGLLKRDGLMYCAGPEIGRFDLTPGRMATMAEPSMKKNRVAPPVEIEAIEFEDIPMSAQQITLRVHERWVSKMRQMPAGKSFAMPLVHRHALRAAATELRKEGWKLSVLNEGEDKVRVVCTEVGDKA